MELHRDRMRVVRQTLLISGIGVAFIVLPLVIGWFNVRFVYGVGPWVSYGLGAALVVLGLSRLALLRPFEFRIDEAGVRVRSDHLTGTLPWPEIFAITIERGPGMTVRMSPHIVLYPAVGSAWLATARYSRKGYKGFQLGPVDRLREPADEVIAGLRRYAGDKFTVVDAPLPQ